MGVEVRGRKVDYRLFMRHDDGLIDVKEFLTPSVQLRRVGHELAVERPGQPCLALCVVLAILAVLVVVVVVVVVVFGRILRGARLQPRHSGMSRPALGERREVALAVCAGFLEVPPDDGRPCAPRHRLVLVLLWLLLCLNGMQMRQSTVAAKGESTAR